MNKYQNITDVFTALEHASITRQQAVWQLSDILEITLEQADQMITARAASELSLEPVPEGVVRGIGNARSYSIR